MDTITQLPSSRLAWGLRNSCGALIRKPGRIAPLLSHRLSSVDGLRDAGSMLIYDVLTLAGEGFLDSLTMGLKYTYSTGSETN
jgi:hypothetical protein